MERAWKPVGRDYIELKGTCAFYVHGDVDPREIVGVVRNIRHDGLNFEPEPTIFLANMQNPHLFANLVVRTTADPLQLARAVENAVHSVDRNQPVADIRSPARNFNPPCWVHSQPLL
jgi:hypothetical protein